MHRFSGIQSFFDPDQLALEEECVTATFPAGAFLLGRHLTIENRGGVGVGSSSSSSSNNKKNSSSSSGGGNITAATNTDPNHIPPGARAPSTPLWGATLLREVGLVSISTPPHASYHSFIDFRHDPMGPNICDKSGGYFFFELAAEAARLMMSHAQQHEAQRLRQRTMDLFRRRYAAVLAVANKKGLDFSEARETLSLCERDMVDEVVVNEASEKRWLEEV